MEIDSTRYLKEIEANNREKYTTGVVASRSIMFLQHAKDLVSLSLPYCFFFFFSLFCYECCRVVARDEQRRERRNTTTVHNKKQTARQIQLKKSEWSLGKPYQRHHESTVGKKKKCHRNAHTKRAEGNSTGNSLTNNTSSSRVFVPLPRGSKAATPST